MRSVNHKKERGNMEQKEMVEYHPRISDLPESERPRERLQDYGPGSLSTSELLAIIVRIGTKSESAINLGSRLLAHFGGLAGIARASFADLCKVHGLGPAKAAQIKAALELGKRLLVASPEERPQVKSPADVANLLMLEMGFLEQEHLRLVLLDTKNRVLGMPTIYIGSLNTSVLRVGELFREAVKANSAALIVVHNHPSGDPTPSPEDVSITQEIVEAGNLLDVEVLDHLVIGQQSYVSLKERGLGFG